MLKNKSFFYFVTSLRICNRFPLSCIVFHYFYLHPLVITTLWNCLLSQNSLPFMKLICRPFNSFLYHQFTTSLCSGSQPLRDHFTDMSSYLKICNSEIPRYFSRSSYIICEVMQMRKRRSFKWSHWISTIRVMFLNWGSSPVPLARVLNGSLKPYLCYAVNLPVTER